MSEKYNVSKEEKIRQAEFADKVKTVLAAEFYECSPKAFIHTYGCQGNVSDSERIMGMLKEMGYRSEERRVGKECRSRWSPYH